MFLDDQLYKIGSSAGQKPAHWSTKGQVINKMLEAVNDYINSQAEEGNNIKMQYFDIAIKRAKSHWKNAVTKLNKEGYNFIKVDGLILDTVIDGFKIDLEINYRP